MLRIDSKGEGEIKELEDKGPSERWAWKHIYLVPFERNNDRVKQQRAEYVQRVTVLDAAVKNHKYIFVDEAGFNLAKTQLRNGTSSSNGDRPSAWTTWGKHLHVLSYL